MKAALVKQDGFIKYIEVSKRHPYLRALKTVEVDVRPYEERDRELVVPIIEYRLQRSFINEHNEEILVYTEQP